MAPRLSFPFEVDRVTDYLARNLARDAYTEYSPNGAYRFEVDWERTNRSARYLKRFGFAGYAEAGGSKIVFPLKEQWVVKIPITRVFVPAVIGEADRYRHLARTYPEFKNHFPRTLVLDATHGVIVQELASPDEDLYHRFEKTIKKTARTMGLIDICFENIGFIDGVFKFIDVQDDEHLDWVISADYDKLEMVA